MAKLVLVEWGVFLVAFGGFFFLLFVLLWGVGVFLFVFFVVCLVWFFFNKWKKCKDASV